MKALGRSPVIACRVPLSIYKAVSAAARKSGRTMSEEMQFRLAITFEQRTVKAWLRRLDLTKGR